MSKHVFVGFGFGPIQGGLLVKEAFESGNFGRIVVSEIDGQLVESLRGNGGSYYVNVAQADGIEVAKIDNVELLNPTATEDCEKLAWALRESTELGTSLPAVKFYNAGGNGSVCGLIAKALQESETDCKLVYTAENNNHAAEILEQCVNSKIDGQAKASCQYINTVVGKMSRVVTDADEIAAMKLTTIAPGIARAFLVESFNRILVSRCSLNGFRPGIEVFLEKDDLLPFEEAKLYGHNAIHALLAYLGVAKGYEKMTDLQDDKELMRIGREAFLDESGASLIKKYQSLGDVLFTESGYETYADDLLVRMTNPYLEDTIERAGRDPVRKLGYNDRIFGTMNLALEYGIEPRNMAMGAAGGVVALLKKARKDSLLPMELRNDDWRSLDNDAIEGILRWLWGDDAGEGANKLIRLTQEAYGRLVALV